MAEYKTDSRENETVKGGYSPEELMSIYGSLSQDKGNWDSYYQTLADYLIPQDEVFNRSHGDVGGQTRELKVYDNAPERILDRFVAGMMNLTVPRSKKWALVKPITAADTDTKEDRFFESVTDTLTTSRNRTQSGFYLAVYEAYKSLGVYGQFAMLIDKAKDGLPRYRFIHPSRFVFAMDYTGKLDMFFQMLRPMTLRQCIQQFGLDNLSHRMREDAKDVRKQNTKYEILHAVLPNKDYDPDRWDYAGKPFISYYICKQDRYILSHGAFREQPYIAARFSVAPDEDRGRSPGMTALADIKVLNKIKKQKITLGDQQVSPTILTSNAAATTFVYEPGWTNPGYLSEDGKQLAQFMPHPGRYDVAVDEMDRLEKGIEKAFYVDIFAVLLQMQDNPQMTMYEVQKRLGERGMVLAPVGERIRVEFLDNLVSREISIHAESGLLDTPENPAPDSVKQNGSEFKIEYDSDLTRLLDSDENGAIINTLGTIMPYAQEFPEVLDTFIIPETMRELAKNNSFPAKLMRSKDEAAKLAQNRAQQQQMQMINATAQTAEQIGKAGQAITSMGQGQQPQQ